LALVARKSLDFDAWVMVL